MKKFYVLVTKEVKELLTAQVILPLILTAGIFYGLGNMMGKEIEKAKSATNIAVSDYDQSATSRNIVEVLKQNNFTVTTYNATAFADMKSEMVDNDTTIALVIPERFEMSIFTAQPEPIQAYSVMKNFSMTAGKDSAMIKAAITAINNALSNQLITMHAEGFDPEALKNPVRVNETVVVGDKQTSTSVEQVVAFVSQQSYFIPLVLFIVIMFAAQMIATSMATEKENKTLETLLSLPVSRQAIVGSKMVGASVIAFISSLVYMFGFRSYMGGLTGATMGQTSSDATKAAMEQLGLTFNTTDYVWLGLSLFAAILVALAIALILGAFAEDIKSVQGVITPLMMLIVIPYFLVTFLDLSSLSNAARYIIYAIPFSHPFLAVPNLFLGHSNQVLYGILYQLVVFVVFLYIAAKIFSTDRIMTLKLNFGKKGKLHG